MNFFHVFCTVFRFCLTVWNIGTGTTLQNEIGLTCTLSTLMKYDYSNTSQWQFSHGDDSMVTEKIRRRLSLNTT